MNNNIFYKQIKVDFEPENEKNKIKLMPICELKKKKYNRGYSPRKTNVD